MNNQQERLLLPQDFIKTTPETVQTDYFITDDNFRMITRCHKNDNSSLPIYQNMEFSNVQAQDGKESSNPVFNCLNPKNFFSNNCFNSPNNHTTKEHNFSFSTSNTASVIRLKSEHNSRYNDKASKSSIDTCHSLINNGITESVNSPQPPLIYNKDCCCKTNDYLTPDSFGLPLALKSGNEDIFSDFPKVPEVLEEVHIPLRISNASTNNVQINSYLSEDPLPAPCIIEKSNSLQVKSNLIERKGNSNDKKVLLTPENFSSVRRKLNFKSPQHETKENERQTEADSTNEKNGPEFQCTLKIPENIYEGLSSESRENVLSSFSFQKNPFPPIGVFWDIENCRVPKGLSATHVVQAIRNRFFDGYKEAEFVCVCDTLKENPKVLEELNDAQVNIMHVGSIVKNAADDKLLQSMRRFADIHGAGSSLILISGDADFATELYDLRYRKKLHVILIHNAHAQDSLKLSAHETALFAEVTQELPHRSVKTKSNGLSRHVIVCNLNPHVDISMIKRRLLFLSSNCGGKAIRVQGNSAKISFQTPDLAARAKKRIDGEDVYGNRVFCTFRKQNDKESKVRQPDAWFGLRPPFPFRELDRREASSSYVQPPKDLAEFPMDLAVNQGLWTKFSSMNNNTNDSYCSSWRMPNPSHVINNGHSSFSSPVFNSSSQSSSSSRDNSPSLFLNKTNNRVSYSQSLQTLPLSNGCQTDSLVEFVAPTDPSRGRKGSRSWSENIDENLGGPCAPPRSLSHDLDNLSLTDISQVEEKDCERKVPLVDRSSVEELYRKIRKILWEEPKCSLPLRKFEDSFIRMFGYSPDMEVVKKDLQEFLQIDGDSKDCVIRLSPLQTLARDFVIMLNEAGGRMLLINFESSYFNRFGVSLRPASFGFPNLICLVPSLGDMVYIKGKKTKRVIGLNKEKVPDLPSYCPRPPAFVNGKKEQPTGCAVPFIPVPPPPSLANKPSEQPDSATPLCDQMAYSTEFFGSHSAVSQEACQTSSSVIYSEAAATKSGSASWNQGCSPQYPVITKLSPVHCVNKPPNPSEVPLPEFLTKESVV